MRPGTSTSGTGAVESTPGQESKHYEELRAAVQQRAAVMSSVTEVAHLIQEALRDPGRGG